MSVPAPPWSLNREQRQSPCFAFSPGRAACVGPGERPYLMGGVAMAAGVEALEAFSEKPLLWASIQFVLPGREGVPVEIEVEPLAGGRSIVQAAASLRQEGRLLQRIVAALGARSGVDAQLSQMPNAAAPEDCPIKDERFLGRPGDLLEQFERRVAFADPEAGVEHLWIRPTFKAEISAPLLALMSDFFLGAHPASQGGASLDNTIRICAIAPTRWVLSVTEMACFSNGAAHGAQRHFAEDGTLLAISSQSGLPRAG